MREVLPDPAGPVNSSIDSRLARFDSTIHVGRAILPANALSSASKPAEKPAAAKIGRPTRRSSTPCSSPRHGRKRFVRSLTVSCYKKFVKIVVRNQTRNTVLADAAELADTSEKRRTGLLKHNRLDPGQGLWIVPCESVHSFFMKFAIDLVYLDRNKKVRKVRHRMVPWRLSACLTAHSILELPAGVVAASGTQPGDQLEIEEER
jgi:uncharacterized membrane protein (UPF0127 family)